MKRSSDNRRSPAEIKYDLQRHCGGLEHGNADMTDFRRPAYSVHHPDIRYNDTQNTSIAGELIRAQGEQLRETPAEYVERICGRKGIKDDREKS